MESNNKRKSAAKVLAAIVSAVLVIAGAVAACLSMGTGRAAESGEDRSAVAGALTLEWNEEDGTDSTNTYFKKVLNSWSASVQYKFSFLVQGSQSEYAPGSVKIIIPRDILKDRNGTFLRMTNYQQYANETSTSTNVSSISCGFPSAPSKDFDFYYTNDAINNNIILINNTTISNGYNGSSTLTYDFAPWAVASGVYETRISMEIDETTVVSNPIQMEIETTVGTNKLSGQYNIKEYAAWQKEWGEQPAGTEACSFLLWSPYFTSTNDMTNSYSQPTLFDLNVSTSHGVLLGTYGIKYNIYQDTLPSNSLLPKIELNTPYGLNWWKAPHDMFAISSVKDIYHPYNASEEWNFGGYHQLAIFFAIPSDVPYDTKVTLEAEIGTYPIDRNGERTSSGISVSVTHKDLKFQYKGDSFSSRTYVSNIQSNFISLLNDDVPAAFSVSCTNDSKVLNTDGKYEYGVDMFYLNDQLLNPDDYYVSVEAHSKSYSYPSSTTLFARFLPPIQSNMSAIFSAQYSAEGSTVLGYTDSWAEYFNVERNDTYRDGSVDKYKFTNLDKILLMPQTSAIKVSYDLSDKPDIYSIQDVLQVLVIVKPTEHVKQILESKNTVDIRANSFVTAYNAEGKCLSNTSQTNITGSTDLVDSVIQFDNVHFDVASNHPVRSTGTKNHQDTLPSVIVGGGTQNLGNYIKYNMSTQQVAITTPIEIALDNDISFMDALHYVNPSLIARQNPSFLSHGTFYILLPKGATFDKIGSWKYNRMAISDTQIQSSIQVIRKYEDTNRTLVRISYRINPTFQTLYNVTYAYVRKPSTSVIPYPNSSNYVNKQISFDLSIIYPYEAFANYGKQVVSDMLFTSDEIEQYANAVLNDGQWAELTPAASALFPSFGSTNVADSVYASYRTDLNTNVSYTAGPKYAVSSSSSQTPSYEATVLLGEDYYYSLKYSTNISGSASKASNLVLYSSLEENTIESSWSGTLKDVDVSQLTDMGINPIVYALDEQANLNEEAARDLDNGHWKLLTEYSKDSYKNIKMIAIDCQKDANGQDFILTEGKYIQADIIMSAPMYGNGTNTSIECYQAKTQSSSGVESPLVFAEANRIQVTLQDSVPTTLSKSASPAAGDSAETAAFVQRGQDLDYTLTVSNPSGTEYKNVVVEDVLPEQFRPIHIGTNPVAPSINWAAIIQEDGTEKAIGGSPDEFSYDAANRTARVTLPSVLANTSVKIRFHGTVAGDAEGTFSNAASITDVSSSIGLKGSDGVLIPSNEVYHKVFSLGGKKQLKDGSTPLDGEFAFLLARDDDMLVDRNIGEREGGGDGIPDKYQITVTYTCENGSASFERTSLTKYNEDGNLSVDGKAVLTESDVPTFAPYQGYDENTGEWTGLAPNIGGSYDSNVNFAMSYSRSSVSVPDPEIPDPDAPLASSDDAASFSSLSSTIPLESRNGSDATFSFELPTVLTPANATSQKDGTYVHRFEISEKDEGTAGVVYDQSTFMAEVFSTDSDGNGVLEIGSVKYYRMGSDGSLVEVDEPVFVNDRSLPIELAETGRMGILFLSVTGIILVSIGYAIVGRNRMRRQERTYKEAHKA